MKHINQYKKYKTYENKTKKEKHILQDYNLSKFFFILHCNIYVFDWQLKKKYNFTTSQIQKFSTLLEEKGFISYNLLSELDLNVIETILKTSPNADKIYKQNPKVYTITSTGRKEGRELVAQILRDAQLHESLYLLVQDLMKQSHNFRTVLKQIQDEEKGLLFRKINIPGYSLQFEIPSKAVRKALKELPKKKSSTDLKLQNSTSLIVSNQINKKNILEFTNQDEKFIIEQHKGISDKEYKEFERENKKQIQEKIKDLYQETGHIKNKDHRYEFIQTEKTIGKYLLGNFEPIEKGLDFLDSLSN